MKKIIRLYLATPIATEGETLWSQNLGKEIESLGYRVYVASNNKDINDKEKNNPTPGDIYKADIRAELLKAEALVVNITGGLQDGTLTELGAVGGYNEAVTALGREDLVIPIIGFTSSGRLNNTQVYEKIPSAGANHLALGFIDTWGTFIGSTKELITYLKYKGLYKEEI